LHWLEARIEYAFFKALFVPSRNIETAAGLPTNRFQDTTSLGGTAVSKTEETTPEQNTGLETLLAEK